MAPIESRRKTTADPAEDSSARRSSSECSPTGMMRPKFNFAANQDGPWPRSLDELRGKANTLLQIATEIYQETVATGSPTEITVRESYVQGVWDAAHWTLATEPEAPMSRQVRPVTNAAVTYEAALAGLILQDVEDQAAAAFAGGVFAWLSWLMGITSNVPWPA